MTEFPNNPSAGQTAAAEQRYAAAKAAADDLLALDPIDGMSDAATAIRLSADRVILALMAVADTDEQVGFAAVLLCGELLRRLQAVAA